MQVLQVCQVLIKTWITLGSWFPSQNQLFKNFRVKFSNSKKISQRVNSLALLFGQFPGVLENDAGAYKTVYWVFISTPGGSIQGISGVLGRFQPFFSHLEPTFSWKSTYIFQILKRLGIQIEEKLWRRLWGFPCCQGAQFYKVVETWLIIVRICHEIWVKMGSKLVIWQCRCTDCHKSQSCPLLI